MLLSNKEELEHLICSIGTYLTSYEPVSHSLPSFEWSLIVVLVEKSFIDPKITVDQGYDIAAGKYICSIFGHPSFNNEFLAFHRTYAI